MTKKTLPEEELFLALSRGFTLTRKAAENTIEPMGITLAEYNILRIAENTPKIAAKDIQKKMHATAPTIAHLIASLEKKKLIKRTKDTHDARLLHIALTASGAKVTKEGKRRIEKLITSLQLQKSTLQDTVDSVTTIIDSLSSSPHLYHGIH